MAYNNGFGDRIDDIRYRHPQSPRDESYSGYNSPRRVNGSYMTTHSQSSNDTRASLQRRFTTDSSKMPTLTPIGQQPGQVGEPMDLSSTVCHTTLPSLLSDIQHPIFTTRNYSFTTSSSIHFAVH